ncbi:hypothetical protein FISHEDRAFT_67470 [Fistulina hepatica ATCC 64428]|uniref:3-carboxy-cis,cis-mucoante lactonizing enzyme n=1 Tax=Fistulina hepatica ATCC 64428 TaxID=1128425 RepID=A0A0D6ZZX0_9AGAR|nr:hypothetical protein FISHEDRAFT_67470 [Fistulina hepatica ATCC 64428]
MFDVTLFAPIEGGNLTHHILAGSFRSPSLFLLAFQPSPDPSLSFLQNTGTTYGEHQFIALNGGHNKAYTTSWGDPPILSSWNLIDAQGAWHISHINNALITATSSYVSVPAPYTHAYSMGGPTGEVHVIAEDGGLGEKVQEILFVPETDLERADKSRVALVSRRTGSHAIEFSSATAPRLAFVPVLGTLAHPGTIEVYSYESDSGLLTKIYSVPSPRPHFADVNDGPRHVKVHPNGKVLYCVTEHSNRLDIYQIDAMSAVPVTYVASRPLMPAGAGRGFRGSTLELAPSSSERPAPLAILTTTRGGSEELNGWIGVFPLDADGYFSSDTNGSTSCSVRYHELPTSGGRSLAVSLLPNDQRADHVWVLLSDDSSEDGGIRVFDWQLTDHSLTEVVKWSDEDIGGSSFSIWLD